MTSKIDNDDDSFIIILGSSPRASIDVKGNVTENGKHYEVDDVTDGGTGSSSFQSKFSLEDGPSPASMMVASTLITDDRSTEELQKRFGELLDENVVLKDTLKENNNSMKEQFMLIASCQEDMLQTHKVYKEKFNETRDLVAKLRQQNKKLKEDMAQMSLTSMSVNNETGENKSGASSAVEFVTSPDDDVVEKLVAQLELVEKQRRQVITENEALTWQKESLETITDTVTKERDDLKEKIKNIEFLHSSKESKQAEAITNLDAVVADLTNKLKLNDKVPKDEISKRDEIINEYVAKTTTLQKDLKMAQIKILDLENIKLEYSRYKSGVGDMMKSYNDQIQELKMRLKEVQTTMFQPMRVSITKDTQISKTSKHMYNVQLYDETLKHLGEYLNTLNNGTIDSLVQTLGVFTSLHEYKLESTSVEKVRSGLGEAKKLITQQHITAVNNVAQIKGMLTIFESIFNNYKELYNTTNEIKSPSSNVEQLTRALVARSDEVQALQNEIAILVGHTDDVELLRAQVEAFRSDFEMEREGRAQMASERETAQSELRVLQKKHQLLVDQLNEVRKISPGVHQTALARVSSAQGASRAPGGESAGPAGALRAGHTSAAGTTRATTNTVYKCPKCLGFSTDQYKVLEDHLDFCLDDF